MATRRVRAGTVEVGGGAPLVLIAGPCVIESRDAALRHAERLAELAARAGVPLIYKSSFDKANRTALASFRGIGLDEGLAILAEVRRTTGLPVLTDVHEKEQIAAVAEVVDVLQTPAFLCRQTDFIVAVAASGKPVNLKKGQFLSPGEMEQVVEKARSTGNQDLLVTERGFAFGYNNLVADMRALPILAATATMKSVCRQRKAGVCSTSTTAATAATCSFSCTSVSTGRPVSRRTSARMARPSSMPTPRKPSSEVRFALSKEDLYTTGSPARAAMSRTRSAWRRAASRDSMTHGPAISASGAPPPTVTVPTRTPRATSVLPP